MVYRANFLDISFEEPQRIFVRDNIDYSFFYDGISCNIEMKLRDRDQYTKFVFRNWSYRNSNPGPPLTR